jgi:hypothetical protein
MKGSVFDEDENDLLLNEDIFPSGSSSAPENSKRAPGYIDSKAKIPSQIPSKIEDPLPP